MADNYYLLSETDRDLINKALQLLGNVRGNPVNRPVASEYDGSLPPPYLVVTPAGGIPKLTTPPGTGTDVETVPGSALCTAQRLNPVDGELESAGIVVTVYNLGTSRIGGNEKLLTVRDAYGKLFAVVSPTTLLEFNGASGSTDPSGSTGALHNSTASGNDTFTTVNWDVPLSGDASFFALGTDPTLCTVHRNGYYEVGFNTTSTYNVATNTTVSHSESVLLNGALTKIQDFLTKTAGITSDALSNSEVLKLSAGDFLQLSYDIEVFGGVAASSVGWSSDLWIQWLGPSL